MFFPSPRKKNMRNFVKKEKKLKLKIGKKKMIDFFYV